MTDGPSPDVDNVLLLVIDALRVDRLGALSDDGGTSLTPNIDALADDGEVFKSCFACINATDSAMTTIMTGQYPTRHGVINHGENVTEQERKRVSATTPLPELITDTHRSVGVDMLGRWHKRGFDDYFMDRSEEWIHDPEEEPGRTARAARAIYDSLPRRTALSIAKRALDHVPEPVPSVAQSLYDAHLSSRNPYSTVSRIVTGDRGYLEADWVADRIVDVVRDDGQDWFVLGHFWDTHLPYNATAEYLDAVADRDYRMGDAPLSEVIEPIAGSSWERTLRRMAEENGWTTCGDVIRAYDASVRMVDDAVGAIVQALKSAGEYDETAVIVTADHGESLTEHGVLFDHHGLYDPTIHVPLVVKAPGFEGRDRGFVQHTDLTPTVLDLLGHNVDEERFDGYSLATTREQGLRRDAVFSEEGNAARKRSVRTDTHKYIHRTDDRKTCRYCDVRHARNRELYRLEDDPAERENVASDHPDIVEELDAIATEFIRSLPDPQEGRVGFEEDSEVLARLESMGYM